MSNLLPDGWPVIEIPNDQVANAAGQYRDAANLLFQPSRQRICVLPLLANAAFSVELYLKSLNAKHVYHAEEGFEGYRVTAKPISSKGSKGHSLAFLFKGLDEATKQSINESYSSFSKRKEFVSVETALDTYDAVFLNSRYAFEDESECCAGSVDGLVELANFFGSYVENLPTTFK
jgi:hypothetical protein